WHAPALEPPIAPRSVFDESDGDRHGPLPRGRLRRPARWIEGGSGSLAIRRPRTTQESRSGGGSRSPHVASGSSSGRRKRPAAEALHRGRLLRGGGDAQPGGTGSPKSNISMRGVGRGAKSGTGVPGSHGPSSLAASTRASRRRANPATN